MAKHGWANFANVAAQGLAGAVPGIVTLNPALAIGGAGVGVTNATYQNVKAHRERKKAEEMAKNPGSPTGKKKSWMDAEPAKTEQIPLHTPQQQGAFNALLPKTVDRLAGNEFDFEPIAERSRRQQQNTEKLIAARFGSYEGGPSTAGYRNALVQSRQEHELGLDSLRSEYANQQRTQNQNLLTTLLQPSFQNVYTPPQASFGQKLAEGFIPQVGGKLLDLATQAGGSYIANRIGQSAVPANPTQAGSAPQTIAAASTPQGQALQQAAQAATPVPQLGGAGTAAANVAKQGGLTTAGKAGLGVGGSVALYSLGKYVERLLRGEQ